MKGVLEKVKNGVLDALFPATCVGCGREGQYICARCESFVSEVALICPVCRQSSFAGECHENCKNRYGFDGLISIWEYEGIVKSLLHYIKYNGITHAVEETTKRAFRVMAQDEKRFQTFLSFLFSQDILITYVPMWRKKERYRGFNQAAVFAKEIGGIGMREVMSSLAKTRDTKPQANLTKEERLYNVKDAFDVFSEAGVKHKKQLVLVDDVWTTGATMKECCKELKHAGAEKVWGFTIARTP